MAAVSVHVNPARFNQKVRQLKALVDNPGSPVTGLLTSGFNRHIKSEYVRILRNRMPRSKELEVLNKGFIIRRGDEVIALPAKRGRSKVGTHEGGRFFTASWTPIADAVAKEAVRVDITAPPGILRVGAVNAETVRERTRFRWQQRDRRGRFKGTGVTEPFGRQWLQVLEFGGRIRVPNFGRVAKSPRVPVGEALKRKGNKWAWTVTPRDTQRLLHPEPGVYVFRMEKTVAPISMFSRALFTKTRPMMKAFRPLFVALIINVAGFRKGGR